MNPCVERIVPNPFLDVGVADVGIRNGQLRRVEDVKAFDAKLKFDGFGKFEVFRQSEIQLTRRRRAQAVASEISETSGRSFAKRREIQVTIRTAVAIRFSDEIDANSIAPNVEGLSALGAENPLICQPPISALSPGFRSVPNCLPRPNGIS